MSFGFSIGDIIKLVELTTNTYNGWKSACGMHASITEDLAALRSLLSRIEAEVQTPNSLFSKNADDLQHWESLSKGCFDVVRELASILKKHKSLSKSRAKNWDRIRLGSKNLEALNTRLLKKIESISAFATVLGISSQGRLENTMFPELMRKVDTIAAKMRKGNGSICTLTTYENDDKGVWREFRREMVREDVKSRDIHRYKDALKTYLLRLKSEGLLDEDEILEETKPDQDIYKHMLSGERSPDEGSQGTIPQATSSEWEAPEEPQNEETSSSANLRASSPEEDCSREDSHRDASPEHGPKMYESEVDKLEQETQHHAIGENIEEIVGDSYSFAVSMRELHIDEPREVKSTDNIRETSMVGPRTSKELSYVVESLPAGRTAQDETDGLIERMQDSQTEPQEYSNEKLYWKKDSEPGPSPAPELSKDMRPWNTDSGFICSDTVGIPSLGTNGEREINYAISKPESSPIEPQSDSGNLCFIHPTLLEAMDSSIPYKSPRHTVWKDYYNSQQSRKIFTAVHGSFGRPTLGSLCSCANSARIFSLGPITEEDSHKVLNFLKGLSQKAIAQGKDLHQQMYLDKMLERCDLPENARYLHVVLQGTDDAIGTRSSLCTVETGFPSYVRYYATRSFIDRWYDAWSRAVRNKAPHPLDVILSTASHREHDIFVRFGARFAPSSRTDSSSAASTKSEHNEDPGPGTNDHQAQELPLFLRYTPERGGDK